MDADGNGSISKDEADDRLLRRFDEVDSNGNGELSGEELRALFKAKRQRKDAAHPVGGKKIG